MEEKVNDLYCFECTGTYETGHSIDCPLETPENQAWRARWEPVMREFRIPQNRGHIGLRKTFPQTKVLTICRGGNSRSVAAGFLLKYKYCFDTMSCGVEKNSQETLEMMANWADKILVMEAKLLDHLKLPAIYLPKITGVEVGHDIWGNPLHLELLRKVDDQLKQLFTIPNYRTDVYISE